LSKGVHLTSFINANGVGFFAPDVTADWNVQLTMVDAAGNARPYLFYLPNREMKVRMYSMIGHFAESETTNDLFARSWALKARGLWQSRWDQQTS